MLGKKRSNGCSSVNRPKYFRFGLRGNDDYAIALLEDYPMQARNKNVTAAQIAAVNAILSNIPEGNTLIIPNFSTLTKGERGFSRKILLDVLNHQGQFNLIKREGNGYSRSLIKYFPKIMKYIPDKIVNHPIDAANFIKHTSDADFLVEAEDNASSLLTVA